MGECKMKKNLLFVFTIAIFTFTSCSSSSVNTPSDDLDTSPSSENILYTNTESSYSDFDSSYNNESVFIPLPNNFNLTKNLNSIFFIYIAADNDLSDYVNLDIKEIINASQKNSQTAYFVFIDDKSDESKVGLIFNGTSYLIKSFEEMDSGNYKTLENITKFIKIYSLNYLKINETLWNNIPFYLIIWDHGDAWTYYPKYKSKAIAFDETSNNLINIHELVKALKYINENVHKINLLGFDVCLMGNIETLYSIFKNNITDYVVASEYLEPGYGWNYDIIFENISNPYLVGKNIVDVYSYYYENISPNNYSLALYEKNNTLSYINHINKTALYLLDNEPNSFDIMKKYAQVYKIDFTYSYLIDSYLLFNNTAKDLGFSFNYTNFPVYFKTNLENIKGATIGFPSYTLDLKYFDYYINSTINAFSNTNYGKFIKDYINYISNK